jgi:hypothetical protein
MYKFEEESSEVIGYHLWRRRSTVSSTRSNLQHFDINLKLC